MRNDINFSSYKCKSTSKSCFHIHQARGLKRYQEAQSTRANKKKISQNLYLVNTSSPSYYFSPIVFLFTKTIKKQFKIKTIRALLSVISYNLANECLQLLQPCKQCVGSCTNLAKSHIFNFILKIINFHTPITLTVDCYSRSLSVLKKERRYYVA